MQELFERFPDMRPIGSPPSLSTVNGIGMMLYGKRDFDEDTRTYVKTQWFTLAFIPIFPAGAYRVADAPNGGWFFLGRVPVSGVARMWPLVLTLLIGMGVGLFIWNKHTKSAEYQAKKKLQEADRLRQAGKPGQAARLCQEVAEGSTDQRRKGVDAITDMLNDPELQAKGDAKEMATVFKSAWEVREEPGALKDLFERGEKFAKARMEGDPDACLEILETVEPAAPNLEAPLPLKQKALEKLSAAHPGDLELLGKLAVVYERGRQWDRCEKMLKPHEQKLGVTEGARILGQIYARQGNNDAAYSLLQAYADAHLKKLKEAEKEAERAQREAEDRIIARVNRNEAPDFPRERYNSAGKQERQLIQSEYLMKHLARDAGLKRKWEAVNRHMAVAAVSLDLGRLQLLRAHRLDDPAARKAELERAEETLMSVQRVARGDSQHQLDLGEVKYCLGKQEEGRKLFDQVLAAEGRKFEVITDVAFRYRDLGASSDARALYEEAYNQQGIDQKKRQYVAYMRSITSKDLDDRITWLEKTDLNEPQTKATLADARGQKAIRDGKEDEAAKFFREAVDIYAAQKESSSVLNNGAISCQSLFEVTGDLSVLDRAMHMMEKAVSLKPRDSILLGNAGSSVKGAAIRGLVGDKIDLKKLRREGGLDLLPFLYSDAAGENDWVGRVKASPGIIKARAYLDRALLLAPKNVSLYSMLEDLDGYLKDDAALSRLVRRAREATPDISELVAKTKDAWVGKDEDKRRKETAAALARNQRVVEETRAGGGTTFAVAVASLVTLTVSEESLGVEADLDAVVKLAEEAHKLAPSAGSATALETALLARANRTLARGEPEYASMMRRVRRTLGSTYLIPVALWREGKPREAALANVDVKRAIELIRAGLEKFPDEGSAWTWVMLRAGHPQEATRVADFLKKDATRSSRRSLDELLGPMNTGRALLDCWTLESAGKTKEAVELLKRCKADGVPLPFDP
jgi:tetratricopeptide (TPR) repeat protein